MQGFIGYDEIARIAGALKANGEPQYNQELLAKIGGLILEAQCQ